MTVGFNKVLGYRFELLGSSYLELLYDSFFLIAIYCNQRMHGSFLVSRPTLPNRSPFSLSSTKSRKFLKTFSIYTSYSRHIYSISRHWRRNNTFCATRLAVSRGISAIFSPSEYTNINKVIYFLLFIQCMYLDRIHFFNQGKKLHDMKYKII